MGYKKTGFNLLDNKNLGLVIYDLDGTLVNTLDDIISAINKTFKEIGLPPTTRNVVKQFIGDGTYRMINGLVESFFLHTNKNSTNLPFDHSFEAIHKRFNNHYMNGLANCSFVYPGATEFLSRVSSMGIHQAVVTNKPEPFASLLIRQMGLDAFFDAIVSTDKMKKKPDPEALLYVTSQLGITTENALMIGDTHQDIAAAKAANMLSAAVTYGYSHRNVLANSCPDIIVDNLTDLMAFMSFYKREEVYVDKAL